MSPTRRAGPPACGSRRVKRFGHIAPTYWERRSLSQSFPIDAFDDAAVVTIGEGLMDRQIDVVGPTLSGKISLTQCRL